MTNNLDEPRAYVDKKRAAIYARVSREEQTFEQQVAPLKRYCSEQGWDYEVFTEKVSGAKTSRKELDLMMQGIRAKRLNVVCVAKLDRLGRSLKHLLQLIEEFNNKDVQFICLNPAVDTKSSQGRFFIQVMGAVAELEREMIRERTKDKLDYLKSQGVRLGRPPGAKDINKRRKSGYYERWAGQARKNKYR